MGFSSLRERCLIRKHKVSWDRPSWKRYLTGNFFHHLYSGQGIFFQAGTSKPQILGFFFYVGGRSRGFSSWKRDFAWVFPFGHGVAKNLENSGVSKVEKTYIQFPYQKSLFWPGATRGPKIEKKMPKNPKIGKLNFFGPIFVKIRFFFQTDLRASIDQSIKEFGIFGLQNLKICEDLTVIFSKTAFSCESDAFFGVQNGPRSEVGDGEKK